MCVLSVVISIPMSSLWVTLYWGLEEKSNMRMKQKNEDLSYTGVWIVSRRDRGLVEKKEKEVGQGTRFYI